MLQIPLAAVPSQTLSVVLAGQSCQIAVYQLGADTDDTFLYMDVLVSGAPIATTRICRNVARVLHDAQYLGFVGDFMFVDTQGTSDPTFDGLGTRYQLEYLEAADLVGA